MRKLLRESFVPILAVLGLLFAVLLYVGYLIELEADEVTVINIQSRVATQTGDDMDDQDLPTFGEADPELDQIAKLITEMKLKQAEQQLNQLIKQRNDSRSLATMGILQYKQKRYKDAVRSFDKAAKYEPLWPGLYFYRALVYTQLNAHDKAEQDYRNLLAINPRHFNAHYNLGLLLLRKDDFKGASEVMQKATQEAGGARRARAHYQYGRALLELGDENRQKVVEQFNLAIRHLPGFIEPRLALAKMEPDTPEGRRVAEEQLLLVLDLAQGNPSALFALAKHYNDMGDTALAIQRYRELLQFEPEHFIGRYNLGLLLLKTKRWEDARAQFDWLIGREPQNAKAYFNRGRANYKLKLYDDAIADYNSAIANQQGQYPEAYLNMGLVYSAKNDYKAAVKSYRNALAQRENYASAWNNLGLVYMKQDDSKAALDAFNKAVSLRNDYAVAWHNIGNLYARDERNEEATKAYQESIRIRPKHVNTRLNFAAHLHRTGQLEKAAEHYLTALSYDSTRSEAWYNLAQVYAESNQYSETIDSLQKMLELEPDDVRALQLLGDTLVVQGQALDAVEVLQHAVDTKPNDISLRLSLAKSLFASGEKQRAKSEIHKGLSLDPNDERLHAELVLIEKN